jgi:hypothetical protein
MDVERGTVRVIINRHDQRFYIDLSRMRGDDINEDLRGRDFTVNAMALDIGLLEQVIDPLGGALDLRKKHLRLCSPDAIRADPLRSLRSVRLALEYGLMILPETTQNIRKYGSGLDRVSPERIRDEIFRIFCGPKPETAVRLLDKLGVLHYVLPGLMDLKGVIQPPPHVYDVWDHTLKVVEKLKLIIEGLRSPHIHAGANFAIGLFVAAVDPYRIKLGEHLDESIHPDRSLTSLLLFAALYHDIAKPACRTINENGVIRFLSHEQEGAKYTADIAVQLHLSNDEVHRLYTIVQGHMRILHLINNEGLPSPRAIYRYFRQLGLVGIDVCLLALADIWAAYDTELDHLTWQRALEVIQELFEAYWNRPDAAVSPIALVNGNDLMTEFSLGPGPLIGRLLESIREAQVEKTVITREDALSLAKQLIEAK